MITGGQQVYVGGGGMSGGMAGGMGGGMAGGMGGGVATSPARGMVSGGMAVGGSPAAGIYVGGVNGGMAGGMSAGGAPVGCGAPGVVVAGGAGAGAGCCGPAAGCGTGCGTGCGSGAGCGAGCDAGCGTEYGTGVLSFVGTGGGDYVAETTYKYVGSGRGDLAFMVTRRQWGGCLALLIVLIIVVIVAMFWPTGTSTTYRVIDDPTPEPQPEEKECKFWGDPHVITFDGEHPSFYGEGEFWIVKGDGVKIQGRYIGTKYTFGLASAQKVAVGGAFIGGHTIMVEPMEAEYGGRILVDGQAVLSSYGSYDVGGAHIEYNSIGQLPDRAASRWQSNVVHLTLPQGIYMEIFRWTNYMDLRIRMRPLPGGQDGTCGNFNGVRSDDTTSAIYDRIGARVPRGENMFQHRDDVDISPQMKQMLTEHCPADQQARFRDTCQEQLSRIGKAGEDRLLACVFDYCFGQMEHALQTAKMYATAEERRKVGLE